MSLHRLHDWRVDESLADRTVFREGHLAHQLIDVGCDLRLDVLATAKVAETTEEQGDDNEGNDLANHGLIS